MLTSYELMCGRPADAAASVTGRASPDDVRRPRAKHENRVTPRGATERLKSGQAIAFGESGAA
ncbi:hypothetical protein BDI4_900012 [Burkholderia diffusa]|nr:hypothetical protein BDI4_900012 [Burkholderia diffusa]